MPGIVGAAVGIVGNQVVARYKLVVGRRTNPATLVADARMPALGGALAGLVVVALCFPRGDPIAVTLFICHVSHEVTADVVRRLAAASIPESSPLPRRQPGVRGRRGA